MVNDQSTMGHGRDRRPRRPSRSPSSDSGSSYYPASDSSRRSSQVRNQSLSRRASYVDSKIEPDMNDRPRTQSEIEEEFYDTCGKMSNYIARYMHRKANRGRTHRRIHRQIEKRHHEMTAGAKNYRQALNSEQKSQSMRELDTQLKDLESMEDSLYADEDADPRRIQEIKKMAVKLQGLASLLDRMSYAETEVAGKKGVAGKRQKDCFSTASDGYSNDSSRDLRRMIAHVIQAIPTS